MPPETCGGREAGAPAAVLFSLFRKVYLMPSKFLRFWIFFAKVESRVPVFSAWVWRTVLPTQRPMFMCRDVETLTRTPCPGCFLLWAWSPGAHTVGGVGEG